MDLLARREHSTAELTRKLRAKNFALDLIQQTLAELTAENLLSHTRFVENYIHTRRNKGFGPLRIQAELLERGIPEELIEHHLQITDNGWFDAAHTAWRKRFKNCMPHDFKTRAQHMRFLYNRGFTAEQIESVVNNAKQKTECQTNP